MSVYNSDDFLFYYSGAERRARVAAGDPSFSRSSTAMRRDRSEIMREVDEGAYRRNWVEDENGFLVPSNRLEAARTNSILRSEEFDHSDWTNTTTTTSDDAVAPDGSTTADKLEDGDGAAILRAEQTFTVSDDSLNRVAYAHVRRRSGAPIAAIELRFEGGSTAVSYIVHYDPSDGSTDTEQGSTSPTRSGVADTYTVSGGTYDVVYVVGANNGNDNTTLAAKFYPARASSLGGSFDAGATGHNHFWGAQLEGLSGGASFPSSYIATTDSAVSRAADDLSWGIGFDPQELTVYKKVVTRCLDRNGIVAIGGPGISDTPRLLIRLESNGEYRGFWHDGSESGAADSGVTASLDEVAECRLALKGTNDIEFGLSVDGGAEVTGTANLSSDDLPSSWSEDVLYENAEAGGKAAGFFDHLATLIAPGVKSMNEMRNLAGTA